MPAGASSALATRGCSSPKRASTALAKPETRRAARDARSPAPCDNCRFATGAPGGLEQRQHHSLDVKGVERARLARLPAARTRSPAISSAERRTLAIREIAAADLEQPHRLARRDRRLRARGGGQAGQQRRPHVLHVLADRIGERQSAPPPNSAASASPMKLQVTASSKPRAAAPPARRGARPLRGRRRPPWRRRLRAAAASRAWGRTRRCARFPRPSRPRHRHRAASRGRAAAVLPRRSRGGRGSRVCSLGGQVEPGKGRRGRVEADGAGRRGASGLCTTRRLGWPRRRRARGSCRAAHSMRSGIIAGSTPRSKRYRASV